MNKKNIILFVVLAVFAAAILFYLKISKPPKAVKLENLVLYGGVAYFSGNDINSVWEKIESTNFYSQVKESLLFKDDVVSGNGANNYALLKNDGLLASFGKEIFGGVFFRDIVDNKPQFDIILLSRITSGIKAKEATARLLSSLKKTNKITSRGYKGLRLNVISRDNSKEDLFYLILGNMLVLSNSQKKIEQAVDLFRAEYQESIGNDDRFRRLRPKLPDAYANWLYIDIDKFQQLIISLRESGYAYANSDLSTIKNYLLGFDFSNGLRIRGYAYINPEADLGIKAVWDSISNVGPEALSFIPLDTALFSGGSTGDLSLIWAYLKKQIAAGIAKANEEASLGQGNNGPEQFFSNLNVLIGFDIEKDILPYLGQESWFGITGFKKIDLPFQNNDVNRLEPLVVNIPELFGCIRVKDADRLLLLMQGLWQRIADGVNKKFSVSSPVLDVKPQADSVSAESVQAENPPVISVGLDNYLGVDVHFLSLNLSGNLSQLPLNNDIISPAYCLLGDYLIIGTNKALLKKIIEAKQGKILSIKDSMDFSRVREHLPVEFYSITYANAIALIDPLQAMLGSFINIKADDPKTQENRKNLEKIYQIMEIIKNIKNIGVTAALKDDFIELDVFTPIE